ncbi:MAG: alpha/beta hydrolase [Tepidiformaceae bacterium]
MPPTVQLTRVGSYEVEVSEFGSGEPIVYLHDFNGPPGPAEFIERLAKLRRVIVPAHPGFGGSTDDAAIHQMINVVVFYQELFERLGFTTVDVVGHSLGGMFAAEVAAVAPSSVRRLVLAAPLGLWINESPVPDFLPSGGNALARMLWADPARAVLPPSGGPTPEDALLQARHTANIAAATNYLWPLPDRGLRTRLRRISAPTLLIWGDSDRVVGPEYRDAFQSQIRGSRVDVVSSAGHMAPLEQPEAFAESVLRFLN